MAGFLREIRSKRKSGKIYSYWVILKTFWDKKERKVRHKVIQNLGQLSAQEVEKVRTFLSLSELKPDSFVTNWDFIETKKCYSFLLPVVLDKIWRLWELNKIAEGGEEILLVPLSIMSEILVLNRAIYPNSDYQVANWYKKTFLFKLLKIESNLINPTRIYRTLDKIYLLEKNIQVHLSQKVKELGFSDLSLIFYDITSSYFEGWNCPLAEFGLSRDHRKDKPQILLALCVTKEGFPIYWRVLAGGIHDSKTVTETVTTLKEEFNIKDVIIVMDKGMVCSDNLDFLESNRFKFIVTIGRHQIRNLSDFPVEFLKKLGEDLEKAVKRDSRLDLVMKRYSYFTYFSDRAYYHELKQEDKKRYILCFNPEKFLEERKQREEKIVSITEYFENWNRVLLKAKYSKNKELLDKEIYSYLKKRKSENLFDIKLVSIRKKIKDRTITTYKIEARINQGKLDKQKLCDGVYCILTNLLEEQDPAFLVSSYRQRRKVEVAFSYLKGFIEIRPFYHQKEERIKAHILVCILGYLLQVTIENLLKKKGMEISFQEFCRKMETGEVIELEVKNIKKTGLKLTDIPKEAKDILKALEMEEIIQKDFYNC